MPANPAKAPPPLILSLVAAFWAPACFVAAVGAGIASGKPNVILIVTDDQGYGDLSCHGNPVIQTPHMDQLAAQGVRLNNFHVSALCSPTRAALLTGRHCRQVDVHGASSQEAHLAPDATTMGDLFSANGYVTGIFGKWHLGDRFPLRPMDRGFGESVVFLDGALTTVADYWGNHYFDDTYWHNGQLQKYKGYCTDVWFEEALRFIERNKQRPFLCYLPANAPHAPYLVPEQYAQPYRNDPRVPNADFYGMIANLDGNLGRLRKRLSELDLEQNTILVFMSDNGTAAGVRFQEGGANGNRVASGFNAGMRGMKGSPYEGGNRVFCFLYYPHGNLSGGRIDEHLTAHIDILPTLVDLCGLHTPPGKPAFNGVSLAPLLTRRDDANLADRVLVESLHRGVMTRRWRFVGERQLYDILQDPAQEHDVSADFPGVVHKLSAALAEYRKGEDDRPQLVLIGSDRQNPVTLNGQDWASDSLLAQGSVGIVPKHDHAAHVWRVQVAQPGRYRLALRRWPEEVNASINALLPREKWRYALARMQAIHAVEAHVRIDQQTKAGASVDAAGSAVAEALRELSQPVTDAMSEAVFLVELPAGTVTLDAWFADGDRAQWSVCYLSVQRLPAPVGSARDDPAGEAPAPVENSPPLDGLTVGYDLNEGQGETAHELRNNGPKSILKHAVWLNDPTFGKVVDFSTATSHITLEKSVALGDTFTIAVWMRAPPRESDYRVIVSQGRNGAADYWDLKLDRSTGCLAFHSPSLRGNTGSGRRLDDGRWHHVMVTYTPGTMKFYVDGDLVTASPVTGTIPPSTSAMIIGSCQEGRYSFDGSLAQFRLFDSVKGPREVTRIDPLVANSSPAGPRLRMLRGLCIDRPQPDSQPLPAEPAITASDIRLIRSMGFDHVKVLLTPSHYMTPEGGLAGASLQYVERLANTVLGQGLPCLLCIHPEPSFKQQYLGDLDQFEILLKFYERFARYIGSHWPAEKVALQLMTEPSRNRPDLDWTYMADRMWGTVRNALPDHTLVTSGDQSGNILQLQQMSPASDPNLIYSFTTYEPYVFGFNNGMASIAARKNEDWWTRVGPIPYPSSPTIIAARMDVLLRGVSAADREAATTAMLAYGQGDALGAYNRGWHMARAQAVDRWRQKYGGAVSVQCVEFGCLDGHFARKRFGGPGVSDADRLAFVRDLREAFEAFHIGWTYWSYNETFTVLNPSTRKPLVPAGPDASETIDKDLLAALGLSRDQKPRCQ